MVIIKMKVQMENVGQIKGLSKMDQKRPYPYRGIFDLFLIALLKSEMCQNPDDERYMWPKITLLKT